VALAFGAVLIGAGVLLFVSAHWDSLSLAGQIFNLSEHWPSAILL
jgi:uncharacterized membrane protein